MEPDINDLKQLSNKLEGDIYWNDTMRSLYATDASAYRELPAAVAIPKVKEDIRHLILFASEKGLSLIPRTAGTSLAGQVVGGGIVVDVSRHFTRILEVNKEKKWVRVQPGVIRDELNMHLSDYGLFFGPETATANRAMVGGMVGNNSCGTHSLMYGSTRDHTLEVNAFLSDGSEVTFGPVTKDTFNNLGEGPSLENKLYANIRDILSDKSNREEILRQYPDSRIRRRNTGYAIDILLGSELFTEGGYPFNFCHLLAGSEGSLAFVTEIKFNCVDIPLPQKAVICIHVNSIIEAARATLVALKYRPDAVELIDSFILECTKTNIAQRKNRDFVAGDPEAIVIVEFLRESQEEIRTLGDQLVGDLKASGLGYHYPVLLDDKVNKVWNLRKAGLGLLSNVPGDPKPVPCIEDTAVRPADLPDYLREFHEILDKYQKKCVHYAHIGDGELHLRPVLNLKEEHDRQLFHDITEEVADLVRKYKGSLSGEHGDGRVRAPFIEKMVGEKNYQLLKQIKYTWDPRNIFNPGRIVDAPDMLASLRYEAGQQTRQFDTHYDFSETEGILRMAEKCNGTGDCRKTELSGGTMCPSYMATRDEMDTTRARANILREYLTRSRKTNPFDHEEIREVLDLCLSCKGCKSECPSNVDMAKLKSEWQQHYYDANGVPFRTRLIAGFDRANRWASKLPGLYNFFTANPVTGRMIKQIAGFAPERSMPKLHGTTLRKWWQNNRDPLGSTNDPVGKVALFCDEFTNYNDVGIGIKAIKLLVELGYEVIIPEHEESGRTYFSKGLLREAKPIVHDNIRKLTSQLDGDTMLLGLEPSAILSLKDEYPDLAGPDLKEEARKLAERTMLFEEFVVHEFDAGRIRREQFHSDQQRIRLHGHCHQKALESVTPTKRMLSIPPNYEVILIPSGCCGMAGSFGYEKEHYEVSMKIGELILFPVIREENEETIIAAPGTSCRHQIMDGTGRQAKHPAEILYEALVWNT